MIHISKFPFIFVLSCLILRMVPLCDRCYKTQLFLFDKTNLYTRSRVTIIIKLNCFRFHFQGCDDLNQLVFNFGSKMVLYQNSAFLGYNNNTTLVVQFTHSFRSPLAQFSLPRVSDYFRLSLVYLQVTLIINQLMSEFN